MAYSVEKPAPECRISGALQRLRALSAATGSNAGFASRFVHRSVASPLCRHTYSWDWWFSSHEPGKTSQVLCSGGQRELVAGASEASQPQSIQPQDALEVCEQHLDLLPLAARPSVLLGGADASRYVAGGFVNAARDLAYRRVRATPLLQRQSLQSD